jgi:4-amino-4-deoxy-L-arabinose transferase-like glycosyltransferase
LLLGLLVFHLLIWWLVPTLFAWTMPHDNGEELVWSQQFAWVYPKHPPLPTWLLYAAVELVGPSIGLTYFLGSVCGVLTIVISYWLAREYFSAGRAMLVPILSALIVYHGYLTTSFNHNTVQLPLSIAVVAALHGALKYRRLRWWLALGFIAGLDFLTKYSAVLLFGCCFVYLLAAGYLRQREVLKGLALATGVFAAVIAPHVAALFTTSDSSMRYMAEMVSAGSLGFGGRFETIWNFLWAQIARIAPPVVVFWWVLRWTRKHEPAVMPAPPLEVESRQMLAIVGFGPLILAVLFAAVAGGRLLTGWGTTFFVIFPLWLVTRKRFDFEPSRRFLQRLVVAAIVFELAFAALVAAGGGKFPNPLKYKPQSPLPPPELALKARKAWADLGTGQAPCAIAADVVLGGVLVTQLRGQIPIVDHNDSIDGWMTRLGCSARGALVLMEGAPTPQAIAALPEGVRAEVAAARRFEPFHLREHDADVTYYAAFVHPQVRQHAQGKDFY